MTSWRYQLQLSSAYWRGKACHDTSPCPVYRDVTSRKVDDKAPGKAKNKDMHAQTFCSTLMCTASFCSKKHVVFVCYSKTTFAAATSHTVTQDVVTSHRVGDKRPVREVYIFCKHTYTASICSKTCTTGIICLLQDNYLPRCRDVTNCGRISTDVATPARCHRALSIVTSHETYYVFGNVVYM